MSDRITVKPAEAKKIARVIVTVELEVVTRGKAGDTETKFDAAWIPEIIKGALYRTYANPAREDVGIRRVLTVNNMRINDWS